MKKKLTVAWLNVLIKVEKLTLFRLAPGKGFIILLHRVGKFAYMKEKYLVM